MSWNEVQISGIKLQYLAGTKALNYLLATIHLHATLSVPAVDPSTQSSARCAIREGN